MSMMRGVDVFDVDYLDETFFGPPPRFLAERMPVEHVDEEAEDEDECSWQFRALTKVYAFLAGDWLRQD
jgi:hypothetical protein